MLRFLQHTGWAFVCVCSCVALPFFAVSQPLDVMPVEISADSLEIEQKSGYAVFRKNVKVEHNGMQLASDALEVFYGLEEEESTGTPLVKNKKSQSEEALSGKIEKIIAEGRVTFAYLENTATGAQAIYRPRESMIKLLGDVVLVRGDNVLKGKELTYDLKSGRMQLVGAEDEQGASRVKARFVAPKK